MNKDVQRGQIDIGKIIADYYRKIYKLCLFYLNNDQQEAEEMVQEIFLKVMKKSKSFKGKSNIYTWIYRIAVNTLINYIKRKKIVEFISFESIGDFKETAGYLNQSTIDPAEKLEKEETREKEIRLLRECLTLLSGREKTAFYLFHYDNMKQKEIAEIMKTSVSAVESLVHKAMKKIKKRSGGEPF
ncbi:MAG: RNA polymerase sigma factor [Candidatus Aminicenantes bacterium]|nr:RNA polymerase sigma factor [Candidatus Aminicenantes bacterium]